MPKLRTIEPRPQVHLSKRDSSNSPVKRDQHVDPRGDLLDNSEKKLTKLADNIRLVHEIDVQRWQKLNKHNADNKRDGVDDGQVSVQESHGRAIEFVSVEDEG